MAEERENIFSDSDDIKVFDVRDLLPTILDTTFENDELLSEGILCFPMFEESDEDTTLRRLSLAYENLKTLPKSLVNEIGPYVRILDISNNEFENLDFLESFTELTHLICDRNKITSQTMLPYLPKLDLLWLNHCKMDRLYPWVKRLRYSCPNLQYLSLMGNSIAPTFWNSDNIYDFLQYRLFVISLFPKLKHLDDKMVTGEEREQALEMFHSPIVEKLAQKTQESFPLCFRTVSEKFSEMFAPAPRFTRPEQNFVI